MEMKSMDKIQVKPIMKLFLSAALFSGIWSEMKADNLTPNDAQATAKADSIQQFGTIIAGGTELKEETGFTTGYLSENFFSGSSFPLRKLADSPFMPPWVDAVMLERVLGSDRIIDRKPAEAYLAYRSANGEILYRWDVLKKRFDPLFKTGYKTIILVLEDIPPCFVDSEQIRMGEFGQIHLPTDYPAYQAFIKAFAEKLLETYGREKVARISFKVGSEIGNPKRFLGDKADYDKLFDITQKAIKSALPEAIVLRHDAVPVIVPQLASGTESETLGEENGVREAVAVFRELCKTYEKEGVNKKVFHRDIIDTSLLSFNHFWELEVMKNRVLPKSSAWLWAVLDKMIGLKAQVIDLRAQNRDGFEYNAIFATGPARDYLVVSAWNSDRKTHKTGTISIVIPKTEGLGSGKSVFATVALTSKNDIYQTICNDLESAGLLKPKYAQNKEYCGPISDITAIGGWRYLINNWSKYEQEFKQSLILHPLDVPIQDGAVSLQLTAPTVVVLVREKSAPEAPTSLECLPIGSGRIDISWKDNAVNETGYAIERSDNGAAFRQIATVAVDASTFSDREAPTGVSCTYRINAIGFLGDSAYVTATPVSIGKVASIPFEDGVILAERRKQAELCPAGKYKNPAVFTTVHYLNNLHTMADADGSTWAVYPVVLQDNPGDAVNLELYGLWNYKVQAEKTSYCIIESGIYPIGKNNSLEAIAVPLKDIIVKDINKQQSICSVKLSSKPKDPVFLTGLTRINVKKQKWEELPLSICVTSYDAATGTVTMIINSENPFNRENIGISLMAAERGRGVINNRQVGFYRWGEIGSVIKMHNPPYPLIIPDNFKVKNAVAGLNSRGAPMNGAFYPMFFGIKPFNTGYVDAVMETSNWCNRQIKFTEIDFMVID